MPNAWSGWLLFLGGLLPARVRELVFEPACYDLVRETLECKRGTRRLVPRIVAILLYVAVANFPGVLFEERRPSRLGLLLGTLMLLTVLALMAVVIALHSAY